MKKRIIMLICICYSITYLILTEIIQSIFFKTANPGILLFYNLISTLGFGILMGIYSIFNYDNEDCKKNILWKIVFLICNFIIIIYFWNTKNIISKYNEILIGIIIFEIIWDCVGWVRIKGKKKQAKE